MTSIPPSLLHSHRSFIGIPYSSLWPNLPQLDTLNVVPLHLSHSPPPLHPSLLPSPPPFLQTPPLWVISSLHSVSLRLLSKWTTTTVQIFSMELSNVVIKCTFPSHSKSVSHFPSSSSSFGRWKYDELVSTFETWNWEVSIWLETHEGTNESRRRKWLPFPLNLTDSIEDDDEFRQMQWIRRINTGIINGWFRNLPFLALKTTSFNMDRIGNANDR